MQVLGYVRVSSEEQALSRAGIEAQRAAIVAECERRGWELVDVIEDAGFSGRDLKRPGIRAALDALQDGQADALVAAKLDRLSRSLLDFAGLMATAQKQGWALVALDCQVDTTTPAGEAMANVMATFAQLERRLIGQRTRDALAVKRANGTLKGPIGRRSNVPPDVRKRIAREREEGRAYSAIAAGLDRDDIPTAQGGQRWYPATVRAVALSAEQLAT